MSYQNQSFGMMDAGYFVPRGELLDWINSLLKLNISKIQQLGSGAVYCQIVDIIHPNKVSLNKVNWKAKNDYQFINNLKILQNAFDKIGIKKHVEVQKLAKAKYQDNLQFIQWLKRYYDLNCGERGNDYNAEERRGAGGVNLSFVEKVVVPKTFSGTGVAQQATPAPTKIQKPSQKPKPTSAKQQQNPIRMKSQTQPKLTFQGTKKPTTTLKSPRIEEVQCCEPESTPTTIVQYRTDPVLEEQLEKTFGELEDAKKIIEQYKSQLRRASMKLDMIKEIMGTDDDSGMKVSLIQEIFKE